MPQVSRRKLKTGVQESIDEVFNETLVSLSNRLEVMGFFEDLLTPTEKIMLSKRVAILYLLKRGFGYREISEILNVSTNTVARMALRLSASNNLDKRIEKLVKQRKINEMIDKFLIKLTDVLAVGSKSGSWKYVNSSLKDKNRKAF